MRITILLAALAACTSGTPPAPSGPSPEATQAAGTTLCLVFAHVGERCQASEDLVVAGDTRLRVVATVQHAMDLGGQATRSVRYQASLGGEPLSYDVDVLGKGTDPADAFERAAQEWSALAGTALVDAARHTGRSDAVRAVLASVKRATPGPGEPAHKVGPFLAYAGLPDFRGAVQGGPRVDHERLLAALSSEIGAVNPKTPHSLLVIVRHDGQRFVCERGQIDGEDVQRVCDVAAAFGWPAPVSRKYSVRQFYMLRPAEGVAEPEGTPASSDTDPPEAEALGTDAPDPDTRPSSDDAAR